MRFRGLAGGLLAVAALSFAPPALAATVELDDVDAFDMTFSAAAGETNRVVVREEANGIRFVDTVPPCRRGRAPP